MEGPRAPRRDELAGVLDLVNRVFRTASGKAPTMGAEFPLLFAPENAPRLRVVFDGDRPVSHVGVLYQTIRVGESVLPVANIGAVCTEPAYRGRGLASQALLSAMDEMCHDGRVLMLISGGRGLYTRHGCVPAGRRLLFRAGRQDLAPLADGTLRVRPRRDEDFPALVRLHDAEFLRYDWTEGSAVALLRAVEDHGGTTAVVERRGEGVAAYLAVRHGGPMNWAGAGTGTVLEWAGDRAAVVGALHAVADLTGVAELRIAPVAGDTAVIAPLAHAGLAPKEESLIGVFRVVDPAGLVKSLGPWWRDRLGDRLGGSVGVAEGDAGLEGLEVGGRVAPAAGLGALTRLVFSEAGAAGPAAGLRLLAPAVPVPLPDSGINLV